MTDQNSPPAYYDSSPPPYDIATDPTQPCNQPLLNPHLTYHTFPENEYPQGPESESRSCKVNPELLAVLVFVVVIGLVIFLPGLEGEGLGSRNWTPWFSG
ncbi:hypothetical protein BJX63DRAFT_433895 [Aspergillus granulosus]|uniref:Uncharacterized protein n=1 Tax=Aspergillus granulosus TaxID=176169 RepID=A0ABR4H5U5_9EURO